jgi:hypothetical protein
LARRKRNLTTLCAITTLRSTSWRSGINAILSAFREGFPKAIRSMGLRTDQSRKQQLGCRFPRRATRTVFAVAPAFVMP